MGNEPMQVRHTVKMPASEFDRLSVDFQLLQQENERLKVDADCDRQHIESLNEAHDSMNRTCNTLRTELQQAREEIASKQIEIDVLRAANESFANLRAQKVNVEKILINTQTNAYKVIEERDALIGRLDEAVGLLKRCEPLFWHLSPDHRAPDLFKDLQAFISPPLC